MDWLDLLVVQGTLKSLLQHHSSKASVLQNSAFFIVQLSHPYMTTGKTINLTWWTSVGKVMSTIARVYSLIHLGSLSTLEGLFFFFWSCNFLFSSSIFQHKYSFMIWIFVIPRRFVSCVLCCWLFFYFIRQIFSPFLWLRILRSWQWRWVFSYKQTFFFSPSSLCWTLFLQLKYIIKGWTCLRMVFPLVIGDANIMLSRPQYCLSERYSTLLFLSSMYCSLFDFFFCILI